MRPNVLATVGSLLVLVCTQALAVEGVVSDPDGRPLENLQVRVLPLGGGSGPAARSSEVKGEELVTGGDGRFRARGTYEVPVLLEIRGDRGAGRVRWDPAAGAETVAVTYPVRETIILLHDNDQHFDFNSAGKFQARVEGYRKEYDDVFLLNAGDIFVRHPHRWEADGVSYEGDTDWYRDRALAIVEQMNQIRYDVMTLGNHELAHVGPYTRMALEKAKFPLLATNVELTTDALPPVQSHVVLRTGTDRTVAVIGLTVGSGEGVKILNRSEVAKNHSRFADEHDVVVALTHIGYNADRDLAEKFPYLDVVIGGHSHTLLEEAEMINGVLVAQAGGNPHQVSKDHPKYLGVITLTLENGTIVEKRGHVVTLPLPVDAATP